LRWNSDASVPLALLKYGFRRHPEPPDFRWTPELKRVYDVVIIGAGGHGLATAYYLASRHGVTKVAVLDKSWLANGNTARNTTIVRANYLTPEGVAFYKESIELFRRLSIELNMNVMYSERGHFTLAHTDAAMRTARWRAEVNKHLGVESEAIDADEVARLCPIVNVSEKARYPILGALYHPPGAIARHDAVAWGYARQAMRRGVEVHTETEVTGILVEKGRVKGVETNRGVIYANRVVQAVAGWSSHVAKLAGFRLPIRTIPLQACVSEPVKPILNQIVVSGSLHVYISQSARGEMVMGGATDPYALYSTRSTLDFKEGLMAHMLELFPFMAELRILRQWAGIADMTPDYSPIMGLTPVENYYVDSGWGTWGFKATPVCGLRMAECVVTGCQPDLLKPFSLDRFLAFDLVGEKGAASVGH
jgi:sarcosine oxidase subunit beta